MDTIQTLKTKGMHFVKTSSSSFQNWVTSPEIIEFATRRPIHSVFYLVLTPLFMCIPLFALFGSFHLLSIHMGFGLLTFLFSLGTIFIFIGIPLLIVYGLFFKHNKRKEILIGSSFLLSIIAIFWIVQFYQDFLPLISKNVS